MSLQNRSRGSSGVKSSYPHTCAWHVPLWGIGLGVDGSCAALAGGGFSLVCVPLPGVGAAFGWWDAA